MVPPHPPWVVGGRFPALAYRCSGGIVARGAGRGSAHFAGVPARGHATLGGRRSALSEVPD